MRDLDDDGTEELGPGRAELQDPAGDGLALHQWRGGDQFVLLQISRNTPGQIEALHGQAKPGDQPARHSHRHRGLPGRDDDPDPGVSAASHGSAPGVHHEADQEPAMISSEGGRSGGGQSVSQTERCRDIQSELEELQDLSKLKLETKC